MSLQQSSEDAHLSFFKTHLREILQLLSDSGRELFFWVQCFDHSASHPEQWISVETFRVLEFLISGSPDGTNLYSLVDLALLSSNASDTGFSKVVREKEVGCFSLDVVVVEHIFITTVGYPNVSDHSAGALATC